MKKNKKTRPVSRRTSPLRGGRPLTIVGFPELHWTIPPRLGPSWTSRHGTTR
ncbi:MAG: hypothetical protein M0D55_16310 [Elusimicrobiota bacterium]|nr:MAG: hypothetical protein M0D55_16310 [Elusimicrobiota bacterium]